MKVCGIKRMKLKGRKNTAGLILINGTYRAKYTALKYRN